MGLYTEVALLVVLVDHERLQPLLVLVQRLHALALLQTAIRTVGVRVQWGKPGLNSIDPLVEVVVPVYVRHEDASRFLVNFLDL